MILEAVHPLASFGLGLTIGFFVGWITHNLIKNRAETLEKGIIAAAVTMVWVISSIFDIVSVEYATPTGVHAIMGLIAGYFFEGSIKDVFKSRKNDSKTKDQ